MDRNGDIKMQKLLHIILLRKYQLMIIFITIDFWGLPKKVDNILEAFTFNLYIDSMKNH